MGTHPIFESDFDCLTDRQDGRSLQYFLPDGASAVQVRRYWTCRHHQMGMDGECTPGFLCQLYWPSRCTFPHCHRNECRARVQFNMLKKMFHPCGPPPEKPKWMDM